MSRDALEYPDIAGYPDGMGFLDQGTAWLAVEAGSVEFVVPSADAPVDLRVVNDAPAGEYRAVIEDREVGAIRYERAGGGVTVLRSTYVDPQLRGRGIATAFIAHVLDERLARGERVTVACPVIRGFVAAHPEYARVTIE